MDETDGKRLIISLLQITRSSFLQIMILLVVPKSLGSSGANYANNLLRTAVLGQYIPRLYRFLPLLISQTPSDLAWANFIMNLLTFMLSGHVVGSCWYLFGLQVLI